jgi:large subunit ribosomal protein L31e
MSSSENEESSAPQPEETVEQEPLVEAEAVAAETEETTEPEAEAEEKTAESIPAAAEPEKEEEPGEEEIEVVEEKIYTIPIGRLGYVTDRGHRAPRAVRDVRAYVSRHMKAEEVAISNEINDALWARGMSKPPRKITVRAVKDKEGKVIIYPAKTA